MPNRNVNTDVWSDDKFTDDFTAEDKYFWLFLLTTRYGNLSGCFKLTYNQIARDMGYSKETAENLVYRFINYNLISYDKETKEIAIHNWYKFNWSKSPKAAASIKKYLNDIKSDYLRNMVLEIHECYMNNDRVSIGYQYPSNTNTISNTKSIPITKPKEEKKKTYGEFENVKLTDKEFKSLQERLPNTYKDYIERVSAYVAQSGKGYKSHYATILNWSRKDNQEQPKPKNEIKGITVV